MMGDLKSEGVEGGKWDMTEVVRMQRWEVESSDGPCRCKLSQGQMGWS